jgi:prevent-host-death family protein
MKDRVRIDLFIAVRVIHRVLQAFTKGFVKRQITQRELRNNSGEIMRALERGESLIVTRNGVPLAELSPLRRRRFVAAETVVSAFSGSASIDYGEFRDDIDTWVDQRLDGHE